MPYIKRKEINVEQVPYQHTQKEKMNSSADFYNSLAWKRLRNTFLKEHPVCQICLDHGRVSPTQDIHHATPFMRGNTEEEKWNLLLDEKNLIPCCEKCHLGLHAKGNMYSMNRLDNLTDKEYNYIHCIFNG